MDLVSVIIWVRTDCFFKITFRLANLDTRYSTIEDSKKSIWEAKITNPFNGFGRGPMESLGCYKDEDAARRAITYFSTICIGDKGIRLDRNKVCEEQRLKVRIAALEIRLQNETAKNQELKQGDRIGMIRFGCRVDVYFENYTSLVKINHKTVAGDTLLAKM